jgi:hypothetical protein
VLQRPEAGREVLAVLVGAGAAGDDDGEGHHASRVARRAISRAGEGRTRVHRAEMETPNPASTAHRHRSPAAPVRDDVDGPAQLTLT